VLVDLSIDRGFFLLVLRAHDHEVLKDRYCISNFQINIVKVKT
jgi:hypothetical protein